MITFHEGNIFNGNCDVVCHQVNCQGAMGSGIAKEMRQRFPEVYEKFRTTYREHENKLGNIDIIPVCEGARTVVNMYAQDNYLPRGIQHTDYAAFETCLRKIKEAFYDKRHNITIGFPYKIGCGLGGGDWDTVLGLIERVFSDLPVLPTTVILKLSDADKNDEDFLDDESEYISDLLTDKYGFCHNGFKYEIVGDDVICTDIDWDIDEEDEADATNYEWDIAIWKL